MDKQEERGEGRSVEENENGMRKGAWDRGKDVEGARCEDTNNLNVFVMMS